MTTALAAAAALVALAFCLSTLERWLERRRPQELAWTVALAMFTVAAGALWAGAANGWSPGTFRVFFLFGAILNVPVLALGTVYLLGGRRAGDRWAAVVSLGCAFAAGVVLVAPLRGPVSGAALPRGSEVFGPLPRVLAAVASGGGAVVLLAGALWSAWRLIHTGAAGSSRRMVAGNLLIAAGTLVLSASGLLNSVLGAMGAFAVTLVAGITLIFLGFLTATTGRSPHPAQPGVPVAPEPAGESG